jgi:hypothetical protein
MGVQPRRLLCLLERALRRERLIFMISDDELRNGMPFILQLRNSSGIKSQWMETLRGEVARHWYDIYQSSDWEALRLEAAAVFRHSVTDAQMQTFIKTEARCILIDTKLVRIEDLQNGPAKAGKPSPVASGA